MPNKQNLEEVKDAGAQVVSAYTDAFNITWPLKHYPSQPFDLLQDENPVCIIQMKLC